MPPEENTNNNIPNVNTYKMGIDPVFKGNITSQQRVGEQVAPASAFNVLDNQKYTPSAPQISIPKPVVNTSPKSIVRTFKGDMQSAIQTDHLSSINIAIAENKRMHSKIQTVAPETISTTDNNYSKNKIIIFTSLLLVIVGVAGIVMAYLIKGQGASEIPKTQELPSLITTEFKEELNIDTINKDKFVSALSSKLNDSLITVNSFDNIYITTGTSSTKRLLTAKEFITLMKFYIPDIITRTLLPDYMVGMFSFDKNLPFIILKTSYFENAYAGMLSWENDIEKDFQVLFRLSGYENSGGILAELTPTASKKFTDAVIVNKDVRLLRNEAGEIILLYGIIDKETIIITVNDASFKEIISRLYKEKELKR